MVSAMQNAQIIIVGSGPAGLMAAEAALTAGATVELWEAGPVPARKLLLAGSSGLNLTNTRCWKDIAWLGTCAGLVRSALADFPPDAIRVWAGGLGCTTVEGSGGRVYPETWTAQVLLDSWLNTLRQRGLVLILGRRLGACDPGPCLRWCDADGSQGISRPQACVLALGGASWPGTGSNGHWVEALRQAGVAVADLIPANCGIDCDWPEAFGQRWGGTPLKSLTLRHGSVLSPGECVLTATGIEGQALYPLIPYLRPAWQRHEAAVISADLVKDRSVESLTERLSSGRRGDSFSNRLRKAARLGPGAIALVHQLQPQASSLPPVELAALLKALPIPALRPRPLTEAISSAGGILADALIGPALKALPGYYACGEMLDWEAPTGGWLLSGCLATGRLAGQAAAISRIPEHKHGTT